MRVLLVLLCPTAPWSPCPGPPPGTFPLAESRADDDFASWGLCRVPSLGLERWFGLRSSSESERLIGRGWGVDAVTELRWVLVGKGFGWERLVLFGEASNEPQDGTGGRLRFGEDMACFLLGCCGFVVGCGRGVAHSGGDCCELSDEHRSLP